MTSITNLYNKSIILIGFKNVGKTVIGQKLAEKLNKKFVDLDKYIEHHYEAEHQKKMSCRQMMLTHGQAYFRELENQLLHEVIELPPCVIALGGGTPLNEKNQAILQSHLVIQIIAPRSITFERIMMQGRPAFFSPDEDALVTFNRLWDEREKVYQRLANFSVNNAGSVQQAVNDLLQYEY